MPEKASPRLAFYILLSCKMPFGPAEAVKNRSRRFFYSPPSMALTLPGHRRFAPMFKIAPGDFLHFAILQNALSGHRRCAPMFKIAPGDFVHFAG